MLTRILFFGLFIPCGALAQDDYLTDQPVWRVTSVCNVQGGSSGNCIATDTYNYFVGGDSVINGSTYARIERAGTVTGAWMGPPPAPPGCIGTETYPAYLAGLVRQEGYRLWQWMNGTDELLYDFDLEVGDTLPVTLNNWNGDITVVAIDSFPVGAGWRKRYELANSWAQYLLEGIGTSHGLFEPVSNFFDCGYELNCYGLGDEGYYPDPGPGCQLPMHVDMITGIPGTLGVQPNPASDRLWVTCPGVVNGSMVSLLDVNGRAVRSLPVRNGTVEFDVSGLPAAVMVVMHGGDRRRVMVAH